MLLFFLWILHNDLTKFDTPSILLLLSRTENWGSTNHSINGDKKKGTKGVIHSDKPEPHTTSYNDMLNTQQFETEPRTNVYQVHLLFIFRNHVSEFKCEKHVELYLSRSQALKEEIKQKGNNRLWIIYSIERKGICKVHTHHFGTSSNNWSICSSKALSKVPRRT